MVLKKPEQKKERKDFTLMMVPHHGQNVRSIRIPLQLMQTVAAAIFVCVVAVGGMTLSYRSQASMADADKQELEQLRQVNLVQAQQIDQLAKETASIQSDMQRLNQLDADLRRMVNSEEKADVSRGGMNRPANGTAYDGQGGPEAKPSAGDLLNVVHDLRTQMQEREESLSQLRSNLLEKKAVQAATPSIWPASGSVTSRFGWRNSPFGGGSGDWHPGIDIANDSGTPILATAEGTVVGSGWVSGYGYLVEIDHGNGIHTLYGHNSQNLVSVGQHVTKGQLVSYMSSTGYSTGPHVHYEVRVNGSVVNPASFL